MKIDGTVTTGLGKAAYFLSQDFYVNNFKKNFKFFFIFKIYFSLLYLGYPKLFILLIPIYNCLI